MHRHLTLLTLIALSTSRFAAGQSPLPEAEGGPLHTSVSLVADVREVKPGGEFTLGILMRMAPGWHTYWKNPGEAGLPTRVEWTLPEGVHAGEIGWPVPHKYNESGDVLTYGYATENMLLIPVRVDAGLPPGGSFTLKADVTWLECERICIPGKSTVELTLPVRTGSSPGSNDALFRRYRAELPVASSADLDIDVTTAGKDVVIRIAPRSNARLAAVDGLPDFYPEPVDLLQTGRTIVEAMPDRAALRVPLAADEPLEGSRVLKGVLVYAIEGGSRTAVELRIPLSAEFCRALAPAGAPSGGGSILDQDFSPRRGDGGEESVLLYILFAVIGGLLLNIMPCVLPVIALKVFGLVKMGGDAPSRIRTLGWFFSLGILASFLLLAAVVIILQAAGETVGWGFQFQEPVFVLIMSAVVFVFGLSLFGVFEIQLPGSVVSGVGTALAAKGPGGRGHLASFGEGVFATVLATPCTAPFLGTALGFAFSQPWWIILLVFTSVAFGMALPYLVLTARPAWTRFLPKPGEWMVNAKQFMGFLMMATLLWLLYVLGKQLGMEAVIWTTGFLLMLGMGCWVIGRFATLTASRVRVWGSWFTAAVLAVAGYFLFVGPMLEARALIGVSGSGAAPASADGIAWQPFSVDRFDEEIARGRTVFIDFTAEWCLTCKVNEKTVLGDAGVVRAFRERNIVALKADWTNRNPEITRLLAKFGRSGVPLYVIFPAGAPGSPIVLPEVITTGMVIDALQKAAPAGA